MNDTRTIPPLVESSHLDLAFFAWLHKLGKRIEIIEEQEVIYQRQRKEATMAKRKTKKKRKTYLSRDEILAKLMRLK